jgi:hypothetical protein
MTAREIMVMLYPGMPEWQIDANTEWLEKQAVLVKDGGYIVSPRDGWIVMKVTAGDYEIKIRRL